MHLLGSKFKSRYDSPCMLLLLLLLLVAQNYGLHLVGFCVVPVKVNCLPSIGEVSTLVISPQGESLPTSARLPSVNQTGPDSYRL